MAYLRNDPSLVDGQVVFNGHAVDPDKLHSCLAEWFPSHRRDYPWRNHVDPFTLVIAEMMLRRTRAEQVVPIYLSFLTRYPTAQVLASAHSDEVAEALYSLGLAWRAPAFIEMAQQLVKNYEGRVPNDYDALVSLPGIGDYVASAVLCFSYGHPQRIVDTNTVRIAGRLFDYYPQGEPRRNRQMIRLLSLLTDEVSPASYNYTLLDLAALICTQRYPSCLECPLQNLCVTGQRHTSNQ